ncbi:MAG: hypothetical protein ACKVP4_11135 [Hyphomicrobium sp.]
MIAAVVRAQDIRTALWGSFEARAWTWWLAAVVVIAARLTVMMSTDLTGYLGDPDDATRLLQVREFMESAPWFDPSTMKIGGAAGMLTHWSRLVDLPLAVMISTLSLVMPVEMAELATRALWPIIVLSIVLWVLYRAVARTGDERAGRFALLLAIACPAGLYQFIPGRIDHHNVMIAATASAALLVWSNPQRPGVWRAAGALCALALAVGYEALAPVAAISIGVAVWGLLDARAAPAGRDFIVAMAASFALAFVATTPPARWLDIRCDAISLNMVALMAAGAAGFAIVLGPGRQWSTLQRVLVAAAASATGLAVFGSLDAQCLAGPLGQAPSELKPIWLDRVEESRSIFLDLVHGDLKISLGLMIFFALAIAAQTRRALRTARNSDIFLLALVAVFSALACWQYKYVPYASVIAIAPLAAMISGFGDIGRIPASTARLAATFLVGQGFLLVASGAINGLLPRPPAAPAQASSNRYACFGTEAVSALRALPSGLFAANMDVTAFIAALTHHSVLSAPYHRIPNAIIANDDIFKSRDDVTSAALLKRETVDYVAVCAGLDDDFVTNKDLGGTLGARLISNAPPAFLTPVPLSNAKSIYKVWRVDRDKLKLSTTDASAM